MEISDLDAIYVTRHGEREDWKNKEWKDTAERPQDPPLSAEGLTQAKELAAALKGKNIRMILCSPFIRTLQTATEVANILDLDIKVEYGVAEWLPTHVIDPLPVSTLAKQFPRIDEKYTSLYPLPTKIESKKFMFERLKQTADAIKKRYLGHGKGSVLIVSHAGPIIALSRAIVDNPHLPVRTGVCSISKFEQIDGKWVQVLNGDCSHLTSGETNHWEFPEDRKREKN